MTEKRFENRLDKSNVKFNTINPIWDNEKETGLNVFEMMDLLNKYDTEYNMCHNDVLRLEKENEDLKQQMQRLYNYFEDWLDDEMPPCGFSEMWDFVKGDKKWD